MVRARYTSRSGAAARSGSAYRGVPRPVSAPERELVPVTDGLVACPECGGGVRVVGLPYTDVENGIPRHAKVIGRHIRGGGKAGRGGNPVCPGVYKPVTA